MASIDPNQSDSWLQCHLYSSTVVCYLFCFGTIAGGLLLILINLIQLYSETQYDNVALLSKTFHQLLMFSSVFFTIGWLLNTMNQVIELFIARLLIDLVTVILLCLLWVMGYAGIRLVYIQRGIPIPPGYPRYTFYVMSGLSLLVVVIVNLLCAFWDILWPRCFIYSWVAFNFSVGIVLCWVLLSKTFWGEPELPQRYKWAVQIVATIVTLLTLAAIASQITSAKDFVDHLDRKFLDPASTQSSHISLLFWSIQFAGMGLGIWYHWTKTPCENRRQGNEQPDSMQNDGRAPLLQNAIDGQSSSMQDETKGSGPLMQDDKYDGV